MIEVFGDNLIFFENLGTKSGNSYYESLWSILMRIILYCLFEHDYI